MYKGFKFFNQKDESRRLVRQVKAIAKYQPARTVTYETVTYEMRASSQPPYFAN